MTVILGSKAVTALERRGISVELAAQCGLHTIRWDAEAETAVPDPNGNTIAFPFIENGNVVGEKYRAPGKKFWQRKGGRKTFWNADALNDPALERGDLPLVITEGELDALSAMTAGFPLAVSVPDGAPPPRPEGTTEEPIPDDQTGKFEFLWNNRDRLKRVKRFVLAVDGDEPGKRLAAELVRRLSPARCSFVEYPPECKDLNDVLQKHGQESVATLLNRARPYPVRGLYRMGNYPDLPPLSLHSTGWPTLDKHLMIFPGEFIVVSGIPNHGKTIWTLNLMVNMAWNHGWTVAMYSGEMPVVPQMRDRLRKIVGGAADDFIEKHFLFIDSDPRGTDDEEEFSVEWVLERAIDAVLRDGIRLLIIDPWNELEHARDHREPMTDYISRSIRVIKSFAKRYEVAVIVVAHPTKDISRDGKTRTPGLYDVQDSSHWANKADHGVIVERPDPNLDQAKIWVVKSRFDEAGERGSVILQFDRETWRFLSVEEQMR